VNFIKLLGIAILCVASLAVLLAVVLSIAALFLGLGVAIHVPFSAKVWLGFSFSHPWFSLVVGLGLVNVLGWAAWRLARGLRANT